MAENQPNQADRAKIAQTRIDSALEMLLNTREGREYLWWLLSISKIGQQPFANNALTTSFNCGELNVGQQILAHLLEVNPAGYVQMQKEQSDDNRTYSGTNYADA